MSGIPATVQAALNELPNQATLADVVNLAKSLSAAATGPNGIIYSGYVGGVVRAEDIAVSIAANNPGLNIINDTDRGIFLAQPSVRDTIQQIISTGISVTVHSIDTGRH